MTNKLFILVFLLTVSALQAQEYQELPLWGVTGEDVSSIRVYLSEKPNGGAVVMCPGGGYAHLAIDKEGYSFAPWLNERGFACIVLKYSLPAGRSDVPLNDAKQAMRLISSHATEWQLDTVRIGIAGFSAGGHLASTLATHFDRDTRPAFQILFYPVITMDAAYTHRGSRNNLLGDNPSLTLEESYSNEKQVTPQTPPAFLLLSDDDRVVPPANSINYYSALNKLKIPCEMHIYPTGGHGWGVYSTFKYYREWTESLSRWLEQFR
ncbi:MAG: alpha/beta hydrolase [Prevotella sp.]|jgi:acetyl esterase/lipase|nr:alpha/beta hydrolase [Prevotella sp.]